MSDNVGPYRKIKLSRGKYAIVNTEDYEYLNQWKWHVGDMRNCFYAKRSEGRKTILMHRVLADAKPGQLVDHINQDGLDNRRENLRIADHALNGRNSRKRKATSKYKGVSYFKRDNRWVASIWLNKKPKYIGSFDNEEDAHKAYQKERMRYFDGTGKEKKGS